MTESAVMPDSRRASTLVIGYGNTLRRDDALGWLIAEEIGRRQHLRVRTMSVPQLTPELAAELAAAGTAVFVDARRCPPSSQLGIQVEPVLSCDQEWTSLVHVLTPSVLLKFCQAAFGHCPRAWQVSVPGSDFSFGEGLSDLGLRSMGRAPGEIEALLARVDPSEPDPAPECPRSSSFHDRLAFEDPEK